MISQEIQDKFLKENWIAITDAISHIKKWTSEKNFQSAENWIQELKKFLPNSKEVQDLEKDLFEIKNSQKNIEKTEPVLNTKESIESEEQSADEKSERFMAALSYASYLVILPLLLKRDSKLCQHHWKQWLVLVIVFFILWTISAFLPFIWSAMTAMLSLSQIAIAIFWWMKAYKWEMWVMPVLWDAAKKIKL